MKQGTCRWLILLGLLCVSAGSQAIAASIEMQVATPDARIETATQKLVSWLRLDEKNANDVNLYARVIALTSTCVLGAWFVMGGIPKRNRGLSIVAPATSERVKVIEGLSFESRPNAVFLQAFPANIQQDQTWLAGLDAGSAVGSDEPADAADSRVVHAARGFVQQWIVAGDRDSHSATQLLLPQETSAEMDSPIDRALLAEVEQYARQLLGRSPGLDVSSFDQMMAVAMAAVDAARSAVDRSEVILCDEAEIAQEIAAMDVPGWVDQDEAILCELWGITPEEVAGTEEDVLGLGQIARSPIRVTDEGLLNLDAMDTIANEAVAAKMVAVNAAEPHPSAPLYEQRIIILGESEAVLEIEKRIVIAAGARVITFRRWDETLKFADEKDFDLLLINGITEDGWSVGKLHDWMAKNRPGWEKRSAFGLSAPDSDADDFASRTAAWCIVHPFGPKELVSFLQAVVAPRDEQMVI
jgi:hypothetical protein